MRRARRIFSVIGLVTALGLTALSPVGAATGSSGSSAAAAAAPAAVPVPVEPTGDVAPEGAKDGEPVGSFDAPKTTSASLVANAVSPNFTERYFGSGPWNAIRTAANNQPTCAGLTNTELFAMVLTTIFRESGGARSAGNEPAPMTLSRYDEWTGTYSTSNNRDANYGLYAFRNPFTPYKRAFWHPGIGIWQYDSAGVGAPYTLAERTSTAFMAPIVARAMAGAYCSSKSSTETGKRYAAWYPWYLSCDTAPEWSGGQVNPNATYCEQIYQGLMQSNFSIVHLTPGIDQAGGVVSRTCRLNDTGRIYPCHYVDPARAQGASWWATMKPLDGGAPNRRTSPATPIALPFYVVKRDGQEIRYWLREDTGYNRELSGTRTLGKNARPKSNQIGSGLTWAYGVGLCDMSTLRGSCDPGIPPGGTSITRLDISGSHRPLTLDANGDGRGDIFWYAPSNTGELLDLGTGNGQFNRIPAPALEVGYELLAADIDGNGCDDVVAHRLADGLVRTWFSDCRGGFDTTRGFRAGAGMQLKVLDSNGDGRQEIFAYGVGLKPDRLWYWVGGNVFKYRYFAVGGYHQYATADIDGNGMDDILWSSRDGGRSVIWLSTGSGFRWAHFVPGRGLLHQPGDFDGDGKDDLLYYIPGAPNAQVYFGGVDGRVTYQVIRLESQKYQPLVVNLPTSQGAEIYWYAPGFAATDQWTRFFSTRNPRTQRILLSGYQVPVVGAFSAGGRDGILWWGPGGMADWLWWS